MDKTDTIDTFVISDYLWSRQHQMSIVKYAGELYWYTHQSGRFATEKYFIIS